jgi:hypothetical protein
MVSTETYSLSGDFPNQLCDPYQLTVEIEESSITTPLEYINVSVSSADNVDIVFESAISGGEKTTLDGLVAAHDGYGDPSNPEETHLGDTTNPHETSLTNITLNGDLSLDGYNITNVGNVDGVDVSDHSARHENTGGDEINVGGLSGLLADGQTPLSHASTHESGGADEIDVSGLVNLDGYVVGPASATDTALVRFDGTTGKLVQNTGITVDGSDNISNAGTFNGVTVETHASRHESGGADEISLTGLISLDGYVVGPASATDTAIVRFDGTTGKLVQDTGITIDGSDNLDLNSGNITSPGTSTFGNIYAAGTAGAHGEILFRDASNWTTLAVGDDGYVLTTHAAGSDPTWEPKGSPALHAPTHENGGGDEINVAGLSGELAGAQKVGVEKNTGGVTSTRAKLNFIEGTNVTLTVADNAGNSSADITINSTGGAPDLDGYVVGPASATDTALVRFDGTTGKLVQDSGITVDGSDNISNAGTYNGVTVEGHASRHESGGADEISLAGLINLDGYVVGPASATDTAIVRFDGTTGKLVQDSGITIDGSDNISNAGTYNGVTVEGHASRHEFGGADEIDLTGLITLDGYVVGPASATDTALVRFDGTTGKLVQNSGITIDGSDNISNAGTYNGVTVETHASRHESGGADEIDLTGLVNLDGYVVGPASATDTAIVRYDGTTGKLVQDSGITVDGSDNISNAGTFNGVTVENHSARHELGGADQIDLTGLIDLDGYVVGPASATDTALVRFDGTTGKLVQDSGITVDGSDNISNAGTFNGVTVENHSARHESGGADEISLAGLIDLDGYVVGPASATDTAIVRFDGTTGKLVQDSGITIDGSDNISNAGTYNGVTVEGHASRHESGGADEIDLTGLINLDGYVVGPASATDTALVRYDGTTGKLVQDSGITVDGSNNISNAGTYNGVTVETHASRHESGGADEIDLTGLISLDGYVVGPASATDTALVRFDGTTGKLVQDSGITVDGSDNISNAGTFNGVTVETHASRHESGGADEIDLTGLINLDGYVVGPASAADHVVVRFDGTTGKLVQGGTNSPFYDDDGDFWVDANGSTVSPYAPRVFGFANMSNNEGGRFQFGDANTGIQNGWDQAMQIYAWHPILLQGDREIAGGPAFEDGDAFGAIGVAVLNTQVGNVGLVVRGASGQTADLQQWRDDSSNVLTGITADGYVELNNFREIRFFDDGANYVGFIAPALTGNQLWTLPSADGSAGQVLTTSGGGGGILSWTTPSGGDVDLDGYIVGPASATDNGIVRFDGTTGKLAQDSSVTVGDDGYVELNNFGGVKFFDDGANYVGFIAPALDANQLWTLPSVDGSSGQTLTTNGSGVLSWNTPAGGGDVSWIGGVAVDNTIARYHLTTGQVIQGTGVTIDDSNNVLADADTSTEGAPRTYGFVNLTATEATRFDFDQGAGDGLGHVFGGGITIYSEHAIVLRGDRALSVPPATWDTETGIGVLISNTVAATEALVVRGATSQTGALQEWRNVGDTVLVEVQADGDVNLVNHDLDNIKTATFNSVVAHGNMGATETIDWSAAQKHSATNSATVTITFTAPPGPCNLMLLLTNGGAFTITWPATVNWPGGTQPSFTASGTDVVAFFYDGTDYWGVASLNLS